MTQFTADRTAYLRHHAWLAVAGMGCATALLWLMGNPDFWTGAPAGLVAIVLRGWYLASEELGVTWEVGDTTLVGPAERNIRLTEIQTLRSMGSFVQVITRTGDKHLIKYQADPDDTIARIKAAQHTRAS
ncbi:MAG: hypothetical protein L3J36_08800 [Rhodobacteraceae bacterium]|nr:hypothetical protein [Paracoccaceae bacterium]